MFRVVARAPGRAAATRAVQGTSAAEGVQLMQVRSRHHFLRRSRNSFVRQVTPSSADMDELVLRGIVAANVLVFFNWKFGGPLPGKTLRDYFVSGTHKVFYQQNVLSLVGAAFSHVEPMHILANMTTFYFFGREVFHTVGYRFGLGMYLVAGVFSNFVQVYQGQRHRYDAHIIGASGAVSSFVVYSVLTNPTATILLWFVVPVPAVLFGAAYVLQDVWGVSHPQSYHGALVGHEAHLAGSLVGGLAFLAKRRHWIR